MKNIKLRKQKGAALVEYGLIIAFIAVVCVGIITTLGGQINAAFTSLSSLL